MTRNARLSFFASVLLLILACTPAATPTEAPAAPPQAATAAALPTIAPTLTPPPTPSNTPEPQWAARVEWQDRDGVVKESYTIASPGLESIPTSMMTKWEDDYGSDVYNVEQHIVAYYYGEGAESDAQSLVFGSFKAMGYPIDDTHHRLHTAHLITMGVDKLSPNVMPALQIGDRVIPNEWIDQLDVQGGMGKDIQFAVDSSSCTSFKSVLWQVRKPEGQTTFMYSYLCRQQPQ